uniref:Uncharacterized protein n=1 Tax=viral metagenome TaxID=1070528 RepID=A0A6C0ADP0_9ZZZZ
MILYFAQFISAGNRSFEMDGVPFKLGSLSTNLCETEQEAVNQLINMLFRKGGIFSEMSDWKFRKKILLKESKGNFEKFRYHFPGFIGEEYDFELKTFDISFSSCKN